MFSQNSPKASKYLGKYFVSWKCSKWLYKFSRDIWIFGCWDSNSHHLGNVSPPRNHLTRLIQPKVCQNVPLRTALEVNFTLFNWNLKFRFSPEIIRSQFSLLKTFILWVRLSQCDHKSRFFQYLAIFDNENVPNSIIKFQTSFNILL